MGKLNIGWVYLGLSKARARCISNLGKISVGVFWFYGPLVDATALERLLCELSFFCQNQKFCIYITQKFQYLMK